MYSEFLKVHMFFSYIMICNIVNMYISVIPAFVLLNYHSKYNSAIEEDINALSLQTERHVFLYPHAWCCR